VSGPEFFRTVMGHRFFGDTMPKIVEQLGRLNTALEAVVTVLRSSLEATEQAPLSAVGTSPRKVALLGIAAKYFQIASFEPQGSDERDVRQVHVVAVGAALRDAYRAGIAAGLRHQRRDPAVLRSSDSAGSE
jgi:hypothetical protein